jgi:hypothetical protein
MSALVIANLKPATVLAAWSTNPLSKQSAFSQGYCTLRVTVPVAVVVPEVPVTVMV